MSASFSGSSTLRREFESLKGELVDKFPDECGNCETDQDVEFHHIVPLSRGGTNKVSNLVRLCSSCHDSAHGRSRAGNFKELQAAGIEKAKADGRYKGRPVDEDLHKRVKELLKAGMGIRATARHAQCSTTTVLRVRESIALAGEAS